LRSKRKRKTTQKEDYVVNASLIVNNEEIPSVPCRIYLPDRIDEKPQMEFRPNKEQYKRIARSFKGSLKAEIIGFDKIKQVSIETPLIYFRYMSTIHWGPDLSESTLWGDPQHLKIIRYHRNSDHTKKTSLVLWISPNQMLSPPMIQSTSYTGSIVCERIHQFTFTIQSGMTLKFDKHFRSVDTTDDKLLQWSFLVACVEVDTPANEVEKLRDKLLPEIDDFLLIASLGSRTMTACLGWEAIDGLTITTYYRGNYTFPTGESESSIDQGLVWKKDFEDFMQTTYPKFLTFSNKNALRNAINSVVPGRETTVEQSFLSMFAGLESLILDYRRRKNLEFIFQESEWKKFNSHLKLSIKQYDNKQLDKEKRSLIYDKLRELNRISIRYAFEQFCSELKLDLTDLWPVFVSKQTVTLSDIRNRIVHGDPLPSELMNALWVARENLKFAIERILVSILGWPIKKSEVNADFLGRHANALKIMPEQQAKISDML